MDKIENTDKEIIQGLQDNGDYQAAGRIIELKKQIKSLKSKLTKANTK